MTGLAASCEGPAHRPIVAEPAGHPGFPSETQVDGVWVEARFVENHPWVLGKDLARTRGVLPIALRIGRRSGDSLPANLDEELFDAVLYLQDGSTLPWIPLEELDERRDTFATNALRTSLVPEWNASEPGFLYFDAAARGVRLRGRHALAVGDHLNRELDLVGSVVALTLSTASGPRRVHVGVGLDRWEVSR